MAALVMVVFMFLPFLSEPLLGLQATQSPCVMMVNQIGHRFCVDQDRAFLLTGSRSSPSPQRATYPNGTGLNILEYSSGREEGKHFLAPHIGGMDTLSQEQMGVEAAECIVRLKHGE